MAEKIGRFRGGAIGSAYLKEFGLPLALVSVDIRPTDVEGVLDLCDPEVLVELSVRPDAIAARDRETTQAIARTVAESGAVGLRWWSSFFGEWHGVVVFPERLAEGLEFGEAQVLEAGDDALVEAMEMLGMRWSGA